MMQAPGGPSSRAAPPVPPDPLASPIAALRAELRARAEPGPTVDAGNAAAGPHPPNLPTATFFAAISRLERADAAVRNAAALLSGWPPTAPADTPIMRVVPTGTFLHQRSIDSILGALDGGQTVLVITDRSTVFEALIGSSTAPSAPDDPTAEAELQAARSAVDRAERDFQAAADGHSGARRRLRHLEPVLEQLRAWEGTVARLLATDREARAGALGVGRLADQARHGRPQDREGALRRLLVAAEVAQNRAAQRDEALAQVERDQLRLHRHGTVRVELARWQHELRQRRADHATAEEQLRRARQAEAIAQQAADRAARARLAGAGLTGAAAPSGRPDAFRAANAAEILSRSVSCSEPAFDLVLIEAADRLPPALLIPLCAAARREVVLCAGAGRPPAPVCPDPTYHHWLSANIDQILVDANGHTRRDSQTHNPYRT